MINRLIDRLIELKSGTKETSVFFEQQKLRKCHALPLNRSKHARIIGLENTKYVGNGYALT